MWNFPLAGAKYNPVHYVYKTSRRRAHGEISLSIASREMQIKTSMSYYSTLIRVATIKKKMVTPNAGGDVRNLISYFAGGNAKW